MYSVGKKIKTALAAGKTNNVLNMYNDYVHEMDIT